MVTLRNLTAKNLHEQINPTATIGTKNNFDNSNNYSQKKNVPAGSDSNEAASLTISKSTQAKLSLKSSRSFALQNGISYAQVANNSLSKINSLLIKIKELANNAAKDTNTPRDRVAINIQIQLLKDQTQSIFNSTNYNCNLIWPKSNDVSNENATNTVVTLSGLTNTLTSIANTNFPDSSATFDNQNVVISYENLSNDILGISKIDVSDKTDASSAVETLDKAINKITLEQEKFEGYEKEFSDILENDGYMDEIVNWI